MKMENKKDTTLKELGTIFLIVLIIGSIFEVGILIFAYINADKVECNFLWCAFTSGDIIETHNSFRNITQTSTSISECYINGNKVNCSETDKYIREFALE